jgi:superfamily II DNA/RNA helicase
MSTRFRNQKSPGRSAGTRSRSFSSTRKFSSGRGSRPFGGSRPQYGNRQGGRRGGHKSSYIDVARFVNKASVVEDAVPFVPTNTFADFNIDERIKVNVSKRGYKIPTPIQDQAIPHVILGRDIVGIANTGTGKTGAFLVPLLNKVLANKKERVLIIVPTRELAQQIETEYRGFASGLGLLSVCVVGGASIGPQIRCLRQNPYFVIGTPGRIKDLIERKMLNLSGFRTVVLDEADRMLDMGFIHDMRRILALMPRERQTLFFSATLSRDIEKLIGDFLTNPVQISVKTGDTAKTVDQDIVRVAGKDKVDVLHDLMTQPEFGRVLVFGRTKHGVEKLSKMLIQRGVKAGSIHGNKTQNHRQRALSAFKTGQLQVLVATDVAARGIDVADVSHVINFDLPTTYDDYVHRIGRTGRAGKPGKALTFVD